MLRLSHYILPVLVLSLSLVGLTQGVRAEPALPTVKVVIDGLSKSLGGKKGGLAALERSDELDFVFDRTVRDSLSRTTIEASHRLVRVDRGSRLRLDVRVSGDKGVDSAAIVVGQEAWVVAEGERHEADADALKSRLVEFAPERLFSVPLTLAAEGASILGDAALTLRLEKGEDKDRLLLLGEGKDGSTTRILLERSTYRPVEVAFRSLSGDLVYRYDDYREISPGLVIPFVREFYRNEIRVSRTSVRRFVLKLPNPDALFSPEARDLPKLPKGR
jgi:hypothetical protein